MTKRHACLLAAVALPAMLAGCGDGLEDRQAAVEGQRPPQEITIESPARRAAPEPSETVTFSDDEEFEDGQSEIEDPDPDGEIVIDAAPDDLIDGTQGFAPTPMDDASGIAPDPIAPEPITD